MKQKNKGRRLGIRMRICICFGIFTAVIIGLLWVFQVVFLDDFYRSIKTDEIIAAASTISKNIDSESLSELISQVSEEKELCVLVCGMDGSIVYSVEKIHNCQIHKLSTVQRAEIAASAEENGGVFVQTMDFSPKTMQDIPTGGDMVPDSSFTPDNKNIATGMIYAKLASSGDSDYVIILNSQITPVEATVNTLKIQLAIITGILIAVAAVISLIISKLISAPIEKTNNSAKRLAEADYSIRFGENGYKEIAELSDTLNYAAEELGKTDSLRKELIANVSHDLRTPLTLITGYGQVMRDLPGENTPDNVQIIIDEADRLAALVNDMLDLSKLEANTVVLNTSEFDITECIENILKRYTKLSQANGFTFKFEADAHVTVTADELKITQVIYNLVNNAVNYCGDDKTVIVRQTICSDVVRIEVVDHGPGIDDETLKYVWDRYYKSKQPHNRGVVGTGLGLSIVKNILDLHGARYGVESKLGNGSDFWFELKKE